MSFDPQMTLKGLHDAVYAVGETVSSQLGLPLLPPYFSTVLGCALGFQLLEFLSAPISRILFGTRYTTLKKATRRAWEEHVVGLVHALLIIPLAVYTRFYSPQRSVLENDKAFGFSEDAVPMFCVCVGYFFWDTIRELRNFSDFGFIAHGAACLVVYANAFRPFLAYYGSGFLLWEASTPLLHFHWFFDKLGMTGSLPQLINGVLLLGTFFTARIVYGGYMTVEFFHTMQSIQHEIPAVQYYAYFGGNILLNGLNWFWFFKMISALRKRFVAPPPPQNGTDRVHVRASTSVLPTAPLSPASKLNGRVAVANGNGVVKPNVVPKSVASRRKLAD